MGGGGSSAWTGRDRPCMRGPEITLNSSTSGPVGLSDSPPVQTEQIPTRVSIIMMP